MTDNQQERALDPVLVRLEAVRLAAVALDWGLLPGLLWTYSTPANDRLRPYPDFDPSEWDGWTWEVLLGSELLPEPPEASGAELPVTKVTIHEEGTGRRMVFPEYCAIARKVGLSAFVERRTHPGGKVTWHLEGARAGTWPARGTSQKEILEAWRGRELLAKITPLGGPPTQSNEDALAEAVEWGLGWLRLHPNATVDDISVSDLIATSGYGESGWSWRRDKKGLTLKRIRAAIRAAQQKADT
jgi:hypothetical protein